MLMEIILVIAIMLCVLFIILLIYQLRGDGMSKNGLRYVMAESEKRQNEALFQMQQQMNQQLQQFQMMLSTDIKQDFSNLHETTVNRLFTMEKQVNEHLQQGYEHTSVAFGKVMEQMGKLDEGQKNLKELSMSIGRIQQVLTDKKTRGIFGEIELYHLLENAFGMDQRLYGKQVKLSNGTMVDAVIYGKEPLHMICIDSKFPLENYNRIIDAEDRKLQQQYHLQFTSDVKKHIKAIAEKYMIENETAEFAYMFLPAEAIFSYIYGSCEDIVNYSYSCKVYIVSPTTLMAYITAIKAIYLGVERNEHMKSIQQELKRLQVEFDRFDKRLHTCQSDFEKSYQDMQQLMITAGKLVQRFKEIEAVDLKEEK